jgi:hypothetical protein
MASAVRRMQAVSAVIFCRSCGRIWPPANDPGTCPCGHKTTSGSASVAMRFNEPRRRKLRELAIRRALERRHRRASGPGRGRGRSARAASPSPWLAEP